MYSRYLALGAWESAHWLEPGETRQWSIVWRGEVADEEPQREASSR